MRYIRDMKDRKLQKLMEQEEKRQDESRGTNQQENQIVGKFDKVLFHPKFAPYTGGLIYITWFP